MGKRSTSSHWTRPPDDFITFVFLFSKNLPSLSMSTFTKKPTENVQFYLVQRTGKWKDNKNLSYWFGVRVTRVIKPISELHSIFCYIVMKVFGEMMINAERLTLWEWWGGCWKVLSTENMELHSAAHRLKAQSQLKLSMTHLQKHKYTQY